MSEPVSVTERKKTPIFLQYSIDIRRSSFYSSPVLWTALSFQVSTFEGRSMAGNKTAGKPRAATKSVIYQRMAEVTKQPRKQVAAFFDALTTIIKQEVGKKGPGLFTLPGLLKVKRVEKKATQDRMGINPQTREPMLIKGKPKRTVVRALPLKALKEVVK
jgi:nucleoid DNA-binding protein